MVRFDRFSAMNATFLSRSLEWPRTIRLVFLRENTIMTTIMLAHQTKNAVTKGYIICLTATTFWSTTAIFIRYLTERFALPSIVLAFWRDTFVSLGLFVALFLIRRSWLALGRQHVSFFLLYGFLVSIFNLTWTLSVELNGAAVATVLAYSSPAFTAVLGWRLFKESLGRVKVAAVAMSFIGCFFVSGAYDITQWRLNPLALFVGLVSGLLFAFYSLMGKEAANRDLPPATTLFYAFLPASAYLLVYNLIPYIFQGLGAAPDLFYLKSSFEGWGVLLLLALIPTIGGFGLYTASLAYLPASVASLIATIEPVLTTLLAYLLLAERMSLAQLLGCALIGGGVVLLRVGESA